MSDIFICYSRADRESATRLAERLRAEGWSVFQDVQTHVGRRWHKEIEKEMHAARALVALWSASSRDSDFVLEEAEYGKRKNILFPAFIERVEPPCGFGRIQTADLVGWAGEEGHAGLRQVLESLHHHLDERGSVDAASTAPVAPRRVETLGDRSVALSVTNHGPGIDPQHLDRIFDRFYRTDLARRNAGQGSGLGLAIVKSIAELHGGRVEAISTPGRETRFRMVFPAASMPHE